MVFKKLLRSSQGRGRLLVFSLSFIVLLSLVGGTLWFYDYLTTPSPGSGEVVVVIARGTGVRGIGRQLADSGLLKNDLRYLAYVAAGGLRNRLKAGEYSIPRGLTPPEVLHLLATGSTLRHHLTIPEGLTVGQTAAIFAQDGWIDRQRFVALASDARFIASLGLKVEGLEGYLFPETYTLVRNETDEARVLAMMVAEFTRVWDGLHSDSSHGLDRHQLVTLASMVEKESGLSTERPLIARVFLNRLALKMRLQSDPTVIFGLSDFNGNLTRADLRRESPYNTYLIPGLPPGPICSPGRDSLAAVLAPAESDALYFVSRNDGSHVFSSTLAEHNRAVQTFQRAKAAPAP